MTKTAKFAAGSLLLLGCLAAVGAPVAEIEAIYDRAMRELTAGGYDQALADLATIDALATRPEDKAESLNLRGAILTREREYEGAEEVLRRALEIRPKFWNASFNFAEIPFLKKDWAEARHRFAAMLADPLDGIESDTRQLIEYKIFLTYVLEGNEAAAGRMIDQQAKDGPTYYFARAALAHQHEQLAETKRWMAAAERDLPASLYKLYLESFYEIGWEPRPAGGEARESFEIVPTAQRAARMQADAWTNFAQAERAFLERRSDDALTLLDRMDETLPGQAASCNLRGEILMEKKKFDAAEAVLRKALAAAPKFREAEYNLARVAFKKREYHKARDHLELLFGQTPGDGSNQAAQLIKFEIFLTFLLEGKESQAQQMMNQFKFTGETPALYYAQAASAFQHANAERGNDWVASARKIYSPALNIIFADLFYDVGWLDHRPWEIARTTEALAGVSDSPPDGLSPEISPGALDWTPDALLWVDKCSGSELTSIAARTPLSGSAPPLILPSPNESEGAGALLPFFDLRQVASFYPPSTP